MLGGTSIWFRFRCPRVWLGGTSVWLRFRCPRVWLGPKVAPLSGLGLGVLGWFRSAHELRYYDFCKAN